MPRNITVTFDDGTTHVYQNAPDDITPEKVTERAQQEFSKTVTSLDGGRSAIPSAEIQPIAPVGQPKEEVSPVSQGINTFSKGLNAGVVSVLGLPVDTMLNIADLGKAAIGYPLSKITGKDVPSYLQPFDRSTVIGSSEQMMPEMFKRSTEDNPYLYSAGAAIPGSIAMKGAGSPMTMAQAVKYGAASGLGAQVGGDIGKAVDGDTGKTVGSIVGGFVAPSALSGVGKLAKISGEPVNPVSDATLKQSMDAGYKVQPSAIGAGPLPRFAEGALSGKAKTEQALVIKNQEVTDKLAKKELGIPDDQPITQEATQSVIKKAFNDGYKPIQEAGTIKTTDNYRAELDNLAENFQGAAKSFPGAVKDDISKIIQGYKVDEFDAGHAVKAIRSLRSDAKAEFKNGDPEIGNVKLGIAKALEDSIESDLASRGVEGEKLLKNFRNARQMMAKAYTVEDAIKEGSGSIDALKLGNIAQNKPGLLSGNLKIIGDFANNNKKVARMPQGGDANAFSVLDATAATAGAAGAIPSGGSSMGLIALPVARVAARKAITSDYVQNKMRRAKDESIPLSDLVKSQTFSNMILQSQKKQDEK